MTYEQIRLEIASPTATITLNRPEAMNAITVVMLGELADALATIAADPSIRAVIITGEGRAFSAGVDLKALGTRSLEGGAVGDYLDVPARAVIDAIASLEAIVIAKINGFCFTGALELALACDLIIAANEAKFGDTHGKWGLRPSWGMSQRLPRLVGPQRARLHLLLRDDLHWRSGCRVGARLRISSARRAQRSCRRTHSNHRRSQQRCAARVQGSLPRCG
jgi:enoyl-CoA hydratase